MQYIGSLYAPDISSADLRDLALSQLDLPSLPPNGFTVLALLLTAIATHCEDAFDQGRSILDRAIYMALEIRINSRTFANMERSRAGRELEKNVLGPLYHRRDIRQNSTSSQFLVSIPNHSLQRQKLTKNQIIHHRSERRTSVRRMRLRWCMFYLLHVNSKQKLIEIRLFPEALPR